MGRVREEEEPYRCQGTCTAESKLACKIELETGETYWVPKSVLHDDSEVYDAGEHSTGEVVIQGWWAAKEGLS